jgi:hypothetical protein
MENNPQIVFERLFVMAAPRPNAASEEVSPRAARLDPPAGAVFEKELPAGDRRRLYDYLDEVREIERRVQQVDATLSRVSNCRTHRSGFRPPSRRIST